MNREKYNKTAGRMVRAMIVVMFLLIGGHLSTVSAQVRWKGNNYTSVADNTTRIYLYNVGVGKLLISGGDWGVEGRLFYDDFGKTFTLQKTTAGNYLLRSGVTTGSAQVFGVNVPKVSSPLDWGDTQSIFTTIMDANATYTNGTISGNRNLTFEQVETSGDTYTYYLSETLNGTKYYIGAAYGTNRTPGKEQGTFVYQDDDRAVWTTDNVKTKTGEYNIFANTKVTAQELYQWRIITEDELNAQLASIEASEYGGLSTNVSYMIYDQDFSRNVEAFYTHWTTVDGTYTGSNSNKNGYRYKYTWGNINNTTNQQETTRTTRENWYKAVRLKEQFQNDIKHSKYGFLSFEGIGTVHSSIIAPATGYYQITCYGFYQGDHEAYMFASSGSTFKPASVQKMNLQQKPEDTYQKDTYDHCIEAGKVLTLDGRDAYRCSILLEINEGDSIFFGVGKDGATRYYDGYDRSGNNYYHDSDWVCADNFQITYLGTDPVLLDEDEESLDYLKKEEYVNKSVRLKRTFQLGMWNSFVFPFSLSAVQVRNAFGDKVELAVLHSVGKLSKDSGVLDFQTVNLPGEDTDIAIQANKLYLIKPLNSPITDAEGNKYYVMGRTTFKKSDLREFVGEQVEAYDPDHNQAKTFSTYIRTSDYASYDKTKTPANGVYVPAGSYVLSNDNLYHTKNNMKIKGFRGWIQDIELSSNAKVVIDAVFDEEMGIATSIDMQERTGGNPSVKTNGIYDIYGRKMNSDDYRSLPKGMYIINGRKCIVK